MLEMADQLTPLTSGKIQRRGERRGDEKRRKKEVCVCGERERETGHKRKEEERSEGKQ